MNRMSSGNSKTSSAGPAFGAIFTVVWVFAIGALFASLLGAFDPQSGNVSELRTAAAPLIWPFVSLALGVPIIVFVWFGGYAAIVRLADLKAHLENVGKYTDDFDRMASIAKELDGNVSAASKSAAEASNQINSNFERYETTIAPTIERYFDSLSQQVAADRSPTASTVSVPADSRSTKSLSVAPSETQFDAMHQLANDMLYEALSKRNESPGRGRNQLVVARGGWNKADIVRKLLEEDHFQKNTADNLIAAFEMEASSRRWGRDGLDPTRIADVFAALTKSWREYKKSSD